MIKLNTRFKIVAPQGTITGTGIRLINGYISQQNLASDVWREKNADNTRRRLPYLPESWAWVWTVNGRGEYVGTFTKRVAKFYYKEHGIKCPASFIAELGNIARAHTEDNLSYDIEFVNEFNWNAGDFGDNGSCFWGSNARAREVMANENSLAVRFYDGNGNGNGIARAWVAPIGDGLYIVFNGYGFTTSPTMTIARVVALHLNTAYKKIDLLNHGHDSGLIYINSGNGFIIGDTDKIDRYREYDLQWGVENVCYNCGDEIHGDGHHDPDGDLYCDDCFYDTFDYCERCNEVHYREDMYYPHDEILCEDCFDHHYTICDDCGDYVLHTDATAVDDGVYCENCTPESEEDSD